MSDPMRVLIADDHALVRAGLRLPLEMVEVAIEVVGEVEEGASVPLFLENHEADVVTLDVGMPHTGAVQNVVRELKEGFPRVRVLVVTGYRNDFLTRLILDAGADGYVHHGISAGAGRRAEWRRDDARPQASERRSLGTRSLKLRGRTRSARLSVHAETR